MESLKIPDDTLIHSFPIEGLQFEKNTYLSDNNRLDSVKVSKLASSYGPLISDFVTHQVHFIYNNYGIHVGQDDRLTFFGGHGQSIVGYFIDCREDSKTFGTRVTVEYNSNPHRRLNIPRGVAHTFDGLDFIVTRDEPIWYTDFHNPDWDINNDLISIPRDIDDIDIPKVKVNKYKLPFEGHILFSKIQQELLKQARRYAKRERIENDEGQPSYSLKENEAWRDYAEEYEHLLGNEIGIEGLIFDKNSYALTGSKSYTIVPSTGTCLSDVLEMDFQNYNPYFWIHYRQNTIITTLDRENSILKMEFCDLRSPTPARQIKIKEFSCDPRIHIKIPAGVAYRFNGEGRYNFRFETELLVDEKEPRDDIPQFGKDLTKLDENTMLNHKTIRIPSIKCPDSALWLLAQEEIQAVQALTF